ncbi:hypothetical protein N7466_009128 [Penicillium verhagenii]|uniref:uncharacterized protein n=1 Tax=Penicillium verhagenii TaxID=1562060 RepID=UPI0025456DDF|nr:uncharacterized protein N7466_009128 [Penicillium verhagenii]KAJ5920802.1 hypothetical protein N7466_009128 [Penicillium verhagenii]
MDPYDSDSSVDEDFTDTGVLLGYAAEEVIEDTVSHLGGWPKWLADNTPPPGDFANCKVCNSPMLLLLELHGDLPDHFPTDERRLYIFGCPRKPCNRKPGSVRAYRATRKVNLNELKHDEQEGTKELEKKKSAPAAPSPSPSPPPPQQAKDLGASLFGATSLTSSVSANTNPFSSNPFSSNSGSSSTGFANPFATPKPSTAPAPAPAPGPAPTPAQSSTIALAESFADKVRISSPEPSASNPALTTFKPTPESQGALAPWPEQSAFPAPYQNYFLDAEYETLSRPSTPTVPDNVQMEPMDEDGGAGGDLKDTFESELDKAFMKFSMRLEHNPEQVLRYEFRGTPLLYSYADQVGKSLHPEHSAGRVTTIGGGHMPRCEYCGAQRVFEVQLVPHAISILEDGRPGVGLGKDDAGMEWGTIVMGVCAKDCAPEALWQTGWREEWAGVQWEETK